MEKTPHEAICLAYHLQHMSQPSLSPQRPVNHTPHSNTPAPLVKDRAMQALALTERVRRAIADYTGSLSWALQPVAESVGDRLGVSRDALGQFSEEVGASGCV